MKGIFKSGGYYYECNIINKFSNGYFEIEIKGRKKIVNKINLIEL
jgi:hypothetical protein